MATQEINSGDWASFFQLFSSMHQGTPVTIEELDSGGNSRELAREAALDKIEFDATGGCSNIIRISIGRNAVMHQIVEPIHVKIRQDAGNRKVLEISAESGSTLIRFHSGKIEEILRTLEPTAAR